MEEKQQDLKVEDNQEAVKSLLNNPNEDAVVSSDPDGNKKPDEEKDSPDSPDNKPETDASESNGGSSPARKSPEPSCAICLEQLQNKSFTDSCFHMFCFTCLVEWSKVKAECPLCKQRFKSIVHNVRSIEDYDQYYIKSKSTENIWSCFGPDRRFHRYNTTMTSERYLERSRDTIESQMASHRMRFAPHAVRLYTQSQIVRMPCNFRRRIYDEHLWVKSFSRDRIRFISPEFYRGNPGCTHRLLPWLNRELVALLQNNETQVTFVMELIMALITRYEITSQEFFLHVEPYLSTHTNHFVHEFYNFAISPYDMEHYDRVAVYSSCYDNNRIHGVSSDNDVIPLSSNTPRVTPHVRFEQRELSNHRKQLQAFSHLKKLILKRNSQNNSWENVTASLTTSNGYSSTNSQLIFPIAGPSTSRVIDLSPLTESSNSAFQDTHDVDSDDDDCQIIDVVKPKNERTPEIVDLLSSDEEKVDVGTEKVIEVSSDDDGYSSTASANRYASAAPNVNVSDKTSSNDNENSNSSDIECVYENENFHTSVQKSIEKIVKYLDPHPRPDLMKVCSGSGLVSTDNETSSLSLSPQRKQKRNISSSSHADDNSTGNCSAAVDSSDWGEYSDKNHKKKKLKLKSVVAHFSYDHERHDSNHRSSHKRHKEKKKKKKKHSHKHKRRIYSDESN